MIDFHTHILPGMDDGSKTVSESLTLLAEESRQGITEVFLTPHFYASENSPAEFLARRYRAWKQLEPHLNSQLPAVRLGAEVQYFEGICSVRDIPDLRISGTEYLLLEMPFCHWSNRMIDHILELNDLPDTQIVLAHIERYMTMQSRDLWKQLKSCGIMMQCNVSFFEGWRSKLHAMRMISKNEIDFLGSDCHNMNHRKPNWTILPVKAKDVMIANNSNLRIISNSCM